MATTEAIKRERRQWKECGCSGLPDAVFCWLARRFSGWRWYLEMKWICCEHDHGYYELGEIADPVERRRYRDWLDDCVLRDGVMRISALKDQDRRKWARRVSAAVAFFGDGHIKARESVIQLGLVALDGGRDIQ